MDTIERLPPHSIEAEEAVLGSLLIDPEAIYEVASFLTPDAFYRVQNRWIYEAMLRLNNRRDPIDFITLTEELRRLEKLEEAGGESYLIGLINTVPTSINAQHYGRVVEAAHIRRKLISTASTIANLAYEESEDVNVVIDRAEQALFGVSEARTTRDLVPVRQIAREYLERIEELNQRGDDVIGVPTGFTDLDRLLGGLNKSDLIIVAARPGMGKCVTADTRLLHPHTGELIAIETLVKRQHAALLTLGADYKLRPSNASHFVDSGIKPVFRVRTQLGREIKTTLSHPFLTVTGWKPLFELAVGDRVGVPRCLPVFGQDDANDHEAKLLAYLLADGSVRGTSPQFSNSNPLLRDDFTAAALRFSGNKATVYDSGGQRVPTVHITQDAAFIGEDREQFAGVLGQVMETAVFSTSQLAQQMDIPTTTVAQWRSGKNFPSPANFQKLCTALSVTETTLLPNGHAHNSQIDNSLTRWLKEHGVWGQGAAEKTVPDAVYRYSKRKLALFLNRLFACDGSVYVQGEGQTAVSYATVSLQLAKAMQHLLLRFGILAKLRHRHVMYQGDPRPVYELRLTDGKSILTFAREIGALGMSEAATAVLSASASSADISSSIRNDVFWDEIVAIEPLGKQQVYDLTVPETHNFVAEDMIVHNTSLQNAIALTAARRHGKRVAMFNLEMSGEQLVQRMIAAETRIDSQRLRRGELYENEWPIFMEAIGRLSETRIFIDDTPSITPAQLRTKCRRLYAEHGLDLVMIDYLQLMQAERPTNNRVQEISEISRGLKTLARELDVPVVAAAQLSRAVEQRQDKRPLLSDLRDSGCLTGDTLITMAETGQRVPIRSLVGQAGFTVWALNEETMKLETAVVSNAFSTGTKPVYRLTTKLGRTIRATANHKFRTFSGWKRLDQIQSDDHLALPRLLPTSSVQTMSNDELALLGYLIGDGCTLPRHVIQYTTREPDLGDHVVRLAKAVFADAVEPRMQQERTWYQVYLSSTRHHTHGVRSVVTEWLDSLGIFGLRSHQKRVPETVFMQPQEAIAWFLRHLWATDGCIKLQRNPKGFTPVIYYATSSVQLAADVQSLLLRLQITARVKCVPQGEKGRDQYHVVVTGKPDVVQFIECIGAVGEYKSGALAEVQEYVAELKPNTNRDVIPSIVWRTFVVPAMEANGITSREMQARINQTYCGTSLYQQNMSRERALRVANAVSCDTVSKLAQSDMYWDQIVSIEYDGEEEVFDLTVPGLHNFVASDIIVHNSIEQDSDIVMFIYRDEYYNAETTERPNIAEIVVAKHRNGPTGTVDLFWHGKLATFRNLQRQEIDL
ncbi:MAG: replicative DNA helicase [Anaerolineales bacterium]|nr:replicative DNA helicase [Anaerolineales bacterium]